MLSLLSNTTWINWQIVLCCITGAKHIISHALLLLRQPAEVPCCFLCSGSSLSHFKIEILPSVCGDGYLYCLLQHVWQQAGDVHVGCGILRNPGNKKCQKMWSIAPCYYDISKQVVSEITGFHKKILLGKGQFLVHSKPTQVSLLP